MPRKNPYRHDGKVYGLTVPEVAEMAGREDRWVYNHVTELGGVKRPWLLERDGDHRKTIRFNAVEVRKALKRLGLTPQASKAA